MRLPLLLRSLPVCLLTWHAHAADAPLFWPQHYQTTPQSISRPVAVVYFTDDSARARAHAQAIDRMARRGHDDFGLNVQEYPLSHEEELAACIDKIAENDVGLIVIAEPRNIDNVMKLPGMYPDVHFSIIGADKPLYFPNVQAVMFNDSQGAFMIGALAALESKKKEVSVVSSDDTPYARTLAYSYLQGAKYADGAVHVDSRIGPSIAGHDDADIALILNDAQVPAAVAEAQRQHTLVITFDDDVTQTYPGTVLTSLLKHYDLALYGVLQQYQQQSWKPGNETVGLENGTIDYALNASNKPLLSKEAIDKVEMIKDLVSQGTVKVNPLMQ